MINWQNGGSKIKWHRHNRLAQARYTERLLRRRSVPGMIDWCEDDKLELEK